MNVEDVALRQNRWYDGAMTTHLETPFSEADILADIIAPDEPGLPPEAARAILSLRFRDSAISRMNELAEKNREGVLSESEQAQMEKYIRVGSFLDLLQAKARLSLAAAS